MGVSALDILSGIRLIEYVFTIYFAPNSNQKYLPANINNLMSSWYKPIYRTLTAYHLCEPTLRTRIVNNYVMCC